MRCIKCGHWSWMCNCTTFVRQREIDVSKMTYAEAKKALPMVCQSGKDGDCFHPDCPQNRDNEPATTGRHCPLDWDRTTDYE